ncbi:hypothetical protein HB770_02165 [Rhizobium leguminosarum bv. viciae]|uniref:Uncharacterized protein n=1 Tax=Rhizobium leguminosarum bv. viciae TaxID=387 RepID=A0A7G6RHF5_RHILV|nr:hypothetical protein HB770_02165 [Rhizobium leguminosarum bv. viciae]
MAGNVFIAVTVIPAVPSYICKRRSDHILIYHLDGRVITMPKHHFRSGQTFASEDVSKSPGISDHSTDFQ